MPPKAPFDDIFYDAPDGLALYARDYNAAGPDAPVVLCLHGLTRNSADFEPLAAHLSRGYRLIIPDQRGRGRSAYDPQPANYTPLTYCEDMRALLSHLTLPRCAIIGTSMGGIMAMMLAAMMPGLITACALNDIGPQVDAAGLDRIKTYTGQALRAPAIFSDWDVAANAVAATNALAFPNFGPDDWRAFAKRVCQSVQGGALRFAYDPKIAAPILAQDANAAPPNLWPLYGALTQTPTLVIRGQISDILSETIYDKMTSGAVKGLTLKGIGHAPILDEPEALTALQDFLKSALS